VNVDKIAEARAILAALGMPTAQQTDMAALTLLVLAGLSEEDAWASATRRSLRVHNILVEIKSRYGRAYAENTRETVRRQVLHQFEQAGIVLRNPDDPTLATNSPRTHYALTEAVLKVLHVYGSPEWDEQLAAFRAISGALHELYQRDRAQNRVPLTYLGQTYQLSPGEHNRLQAAVIAEFAPRFAPGAKLLYLGDSENKRLIIDADELARLNIPFTQHDKLPDIVLYDEPANVVYLIEAVTSHGPVSYKRRVELERLLEHCDAGRIYVSAFPDFATFRGFITEIAWETEVWLSEIPAHLIHFDGDHYLTPRK
jgi:type II restriction enzyme